MNAPLLTVAIRSEHDVVLARQRARQIAALAGLDARRQTHMATAVSEIARNAHQYAMGGTLEFLIESMPRPMLLARVRDRGPGIADLPDVLAGRYRSSQGMGLGIVGAKRLMERFEIETRPEGGTAVVLGLRLPGSADGFNPPCLDELASSLARQPPETPFAEVLQQNQELLRVQGEMLMQQQVLAALNRRLEEADAAKDSFLAMLGHELRNLLGALRNAIAVLERRPDERVRSEMERIAHDQIGHLARLVDDLLDASRIAKGKLGLNPKRLDLVAETAYLLEGCRSEVEEAGLRLAVDLEPRPVWVELDPTRLAQVLGNLLTNARKFTDPGGEIRVRLWVDQEAETVRLEVRDNGCGLRAESLESIFAPFVQEEEARGRMTGGLGLGLPIVKALVEAQGGQLTAASEGLGLGSTFTITLPLAEPPTSAASAPSSDTEAATVEVAEPTHRRILIVDDHHEAAMALAELLRLDGHNVTVAGDGPSALEAVAAMSPEVVFCDLGLPGMDGFEVARTLRDQPGGDALALYAVSGFGDASAKRRAHEAGFDSHLLKPVNLEQLQELLTTVPPTVSTSPADPPA